MFSQEFPSSLGPEIWAGTGGPQPIAHGLASKDSQVNKLGGAWGPSPGSVEEGATHWVWAEPKGPHRPLQGPKYWGWSSSWVPHMSSSLAPLPSWGAWGMVSNYSGPQFPHQQNGDENHRGLLREFSEVRSVKLRAAAIGLGV